MTHLLAWMVDHAAAAVAATAFAVLIFILIRGLVLLFSWWSEQRDRAELVRHLKSLDQHAAELRRRGRS